VPGRIQTIRDLIPFAMTSDKILWTREDVARVIREVVFEVLAPPEAIYHENADFVRDLGLG
jgi:hypothetical protein